MVFTHSNRTAEQHLVAGARRVGSRTAQVRDDYGQTVYVIERGPAAADQATDLQAGMVIEGDATDPEILRQTGFEDADVLAALTGDGLTNFAVCAEMRHLTDDIRTGARLTAPEQTDSAQESVDEIVYPERVGSDADGTEIARPDTTLEPDRRYLVAAEPSVADDVHKLLIGCPG